MKKILGLDLGTTSIGWSFIHLNEEEPSKSTIQSGVRITPLTTDERDSFSKGQQISTNANRTLARGARKTLDRYQLRREQLREIFHDLGWLDKDADPAFKESSKDNRQSHQVWAVRAAAASEKISLEELAKVFLHMNKKRGFKSNRKAVTEEESTDFKEAIKESDRAVKELGYTIGQWVQEQKDERENIAVKIFNNITFSRALHGEEFETIWNTQSQFYPGLTEELKVKIGNHTLFYQRPLKSQKHRLSNCVFVPKRKVIPASHPLFELFRAWHDVNNLRVKRASDLSEVELGLDVKKAIVEVMCDLDMMQHKLGNKKNPFAVKLKLTESDVKSILAKEIGGTKNDYIVNFEQLLTCATWLKLQKAAKESSFKGFDLKELDFTLKDEKYNNLPLNKLWHLLYSVEDHDAVLASLSKQFDMTPEQAEIFAAVSFKDAYGSLSTHAIKKILIHLQEGHVYSEAAELAGYKHSESLTSEENEARELLDQLPPLKKGSLRNPVVEKIMNQLINVVNEILKDERMGRPDEIHVEMARELTATAKQRQKMTLNNATSRREHEAIREKLINEFGVKKVSRNDIIKYKLGEECNWVSIYTGKPIEKYKVFHTAEYDIEHIIPKSRLFDDSFGNKTLCEAVVNREKGNMTAFDYLATKGSEALEAYIERIKELTKGGKNRNISPGKEAKLLMPLDKIPDDFISRQLNETRFIAREALNRLKQVTRKTVPTSGILTNHLRKEWGFEDIIKELNWSKYEELGMTYEKEDKLGKKYKEIRDWSKRDDHRHHAMDAITVGLTSFSMVQHANKLSKHTGDYQSFKQAADSRKISVRRFECPIPNARGLAKESLANILVSYKSGKRVASYSKSRIKTTKGIQERKIIIPRGQLHLETVYGKNKEQGSPFLLSKITDANLIVDQVIQKAFSDRLSRYNNNPKLAFNAKNIKNDPFLVNNEEVKEAVCWNEFFSIRTKVDESLDISKVIDKAVREVLEKRLAEYGDKKKAFANLEENPIWFDKKRGIQIKKVRIRARPKMAEPIHTSAETGKPVDYVALNNNHHIAIYKTSDGKLTSRMVTVFEAVSRRQQGLPIIETDPNDGRAYLAHFTANEYFLFGDEIPESRVELSKNLFRVQKLSSQSDGKIDIQFRHHLETQIQRETDFSMRRIRSIPKLPKFKVRLNHLGEVVDIIEIHY